MSKKALLLSLLTFISFGMTGCTNKKGFRVAATPIPQAEMLEFAKPELKEKGIDLTIVITDDYNIPNRALADGDLSANFFQHLPFLEEQVKQFHYPIVSVAKIELEPMGIYSKKYSSIQNLPYKATIAIPNDPTNEARALFLLQDHGLIHLDTASFNATVQNISDNPHEFQFIEVSAATLPRTLRDVDAAAINTNYALLADLNPDQDALIIESKNSPYANVIAVKKGNENDPEVQALIEAMTSDKMKAFIEKKYQGNIIPAF